MTQNVFAIQDSCTLGVWAAYDPIRGAIILDTEGMLGQTGKEPSNGGEISIMPINGSSNVSFFMVVSHTSQLFGRLEVVVYLSE